RPDQKSTDQHHFLLHPLGEMGWEHIDLRIQPEHFKQFPCPLQCILFFYAVCHGGHQYMFFECQFLIQYRGFRNICKMPPVVFGIFTDRNAVYTDFARMRHQESQYMFDGRTLPCAVQPDESADFPLFDFEGDIMNDRGLRVTACQMFYFQYHNRLPFIYDHLFVYLYYINISQLNNGGTMND